MLNKETFLIQGDLKVIPSIEPAIYGTGSVNIDGDLEVSGNVNILGNITAEHGTLRGLLDDDHTQYALLAGRTGGQILTGGIASGNNLTIRSTTDATKGSIIIDEITTSTSSVTGALQVSGGIAISNTTDAISFTNGGTFTTAGGMAIAKKLFVGTDISVTGVSTLGLVNSGNTDIIGTLSVSGNSTLAALSTTDITASGTLSVTGISTLGAVNSGNTAITGTLSVSGNSTLATLSVTNITASGTLSVTGISTLGAVNSGNTAISGTLNVSGASTLNTIISVNTSASTSNTTGAVTLAGGIGISNTTDALSVTNGGTFTTAGGAAIAKSLFVGESISVGTNLSVGGSTTLTGSMTASSASFSGSVVINGTTSSTSNTTGILTLAGGLGISNATNAINSTNGGSLTTAGGIAVAQDAYIGGNLVVTTGITFGGLSAINAGSNIGVGGIGLFRDISGSTIRFRNLNVTNNKLSVDLDAVNNEVDIGLNEANVVHQNLSGAGTNTHAQIDTHIASTNNPHNVTINQISPATTKGDLLVRNVSVTTRLPVGLDNQILIADSATATGIRWGTTSGLMTVLIRDIKAAGTNGGSSTANTWITRTLNTLDGNNVEAGITLTANTFTLPAGRYVVSVSAPGFRCQGFKTRLFNATDNVIQSTGQSGYSGNPLLSSSTNSYSFLEDYIDINTNKSFIIQQNSELSVANEGFGRAVGLGASEVYTMIRIEVLETF